MNCFYSFIYRMWQYIVLLEKAKWSLLKSSRQKIFTRSHWRSSNHYTRVNAIMPWIRIYWYKTPLQSEEIDSMSFVLFVDKEIAKQLFTYFPIIRRCHLPTLQKSVLPSANWFDNSKRQTGVEKERIRVWYELSWLKWTLKNDFCRCKTWL